MRKRNQKAIQMRKIFELERQLWRYWHNFYGMYEATSYERKARKSFSQNGIKLPKNQLESFARSSSTFVFGDNRLVPEDQEMMLQILRQWIRFCKKLILITDRFPKSSQSLLNRLLRGEVSTNDFLKNVFETSSGLYTEKGVVQLLEWVRKQRIKVIACGTSGSLEGQDLRLIQTILKYKNPNSTIWVWTGSIRVAPCHLPSSFRGFNENALFLSLDSPETRWHNFMSKGFLRLGSNCFVYLNRSPLLSLELFRAWRTKDGPVLSPSHLKTRLFDFISEIAQIAGEPAPPKPMKVLHPFETASLKWILSGSISKSVRSFIYERLKRAESAVVPQYRIILLSTLDMGHVAEEAAHYCHLASYHKCRFGPIFSVVEEALAYLASTWIVPGRNERWSEKRDVSSWKTVHKLGYSLGKKLSQEWKKSKKARSMILECWRIRPKNEKEAGLLWQEMKAIV